MTNDATKLNMINNINSNMNNIVNSSNEKQCEQHE